MRVLAAVAVAALSIACAPSAAPVHSTAPLVGEDTCGMAQHVNLIGVREADINRASLPAGTRVICATCLVTQDYSAQRLNLHLSADGRVGSMRCG